MVGIQYLKRNKKKYKYGDYVRTKKGTFDIVTEPKANIGVVRCKKTKYWREDIIKHSRNIIDLIEVDDIVFTEDSIGYSFIHIYSVEMLEALKEDVKNEVIIKSVMTHQQYEQNCYKLN